MLTADNEPFLIPSAVAHQLGVHPSAVIRWMTKGTLLADGSRLRLRHIKLPGSYRIRQQWVDDYLAALASDRQRPSESTQIAKPARSARIDAMNRRLVEAGFLP